MEVNWKCRYAPSLGNLEGTVIDAWGTPIYNPMNIGEEDLPVVFFGLYGLNDFYALWRHKGRKAILWAGSDIRHFRDFYWLDDKGDFRIPSTSLALWINKYCESWVENDVEYNALKSMGIESKICPSFMGDVNDFTPQNIDKNKRYFSSVSGNDFKLYGWDKLNAIAEANPDTEYHLYGNTVDWEAPKNVVVHGRVTKEEMNKEAKSMTGCIRLVEFEGCSEILVKSVLWGQKPISLIDYPFLHSENPREELLKTLNKYPWVK